MKVLNWDNPKPHFKWPVAVAQAIEAPAEEVWAAISSPGNLERCHPFCAANPVHQWPGEQSRDEVHYLNGRVFERRFCRWIDQIGYDLEIGSKGRKTSFVSWRIRSVSEQSSILRIAVYPYPLQNLPVVLRWLPHHLRLKPLLSDYLSSVLRGFEYYLVHGEPVPRDHFGKHPWFSKFGCSGYGK